MRENSFFYCSKMLEHVEIALLQFASFFKKQTFQQKNMLPQKPYQWRTQDLVKRGATTGGLGAKPPAAGG